MFRTELQETFVIEDCITSVDSISKSFTTSTKTETILEFDNTIDYIIEYDIITSNNDYHTNLNTTNGADGQKLGIGSDENNMYVFISGSTQTISQSILRSYSVKYVKENNALKVYLNDGLVYTETSSLVSSVKYVNLTSWLYSKTIEIKNLRVKAL